ncbi:U11/U12 small nuclear ribonucleoprotein 25 kDa protein [Anolis carolinensis]|uniref:Ubiquitin-like domain-containing protein n=1 Tax=Anolis carolinensis TaxID=28377 RepID=H9GNA8_ANOCA|nr:PREDICTED: U11/U12 small nuclear ribonucleoprotein 25 kDa protein [Anolis carolinensis]|eukprot:XP_003229301.1 PREDICTED: U11/U12 small nuclear ribonucleoprotein 25 kDa protein [Anolis carolinensis]
MEEEEEEEVEEEEAHAEVLEFWQEGLARLVRDPLLCDLPAQVTPEEISSQVALEYGQAMTVRVRRADAPEAPLPVVVVQNASVLDLKRALRRFVQLRQEREGGIQHISWRYLWRTYCLTFGGEKLTDDRKKLREYGIRNRDEVTFVKKIRK